mgnify:CR=1 FL=1
MSELKFPYTEKEIFMKMDNDPEWTKANRKLLHELGFISDLQLFYIELDEFKSIVMDKLFWWLK